MTKVILLPQLCKIPLKSENAAEKGQNAFARNKTSLSLVLKITQSDTTFLY